MEPSQITDIYNRLVAKCWADAGFKARILADPAKVLKAEGVELPAGIEFKIVENTPNLQYWVLPVPPIEAGELDDEQLNRISGGAGVYPANWTPEMIQQYHNIDFSQMNAPKGDKNSTEFCA
jgi:hypothetical protein